MNHPQRNFASIYELNGELLGLINTIDEIGIDEETKEQAILEYIESQGGNLEQLVKAIRSAEREAEACEAEIKSIREKKQVRENRAARLKTGLKQFLEASGQTRVPAGVFTVSLQANPPSVGIDPDFDLANLPEDLKAVTITPNKSEILKKLKAGEAVPGCTLQEGTHVRIR